MKNILLVMPKFSYTADGRNLPPIGILYISACMKKAGLSVFTLNLNLVEGDLERALTETIKANHIHFVGAGGMVLEHPELEFVLATAKKVNPQIITFLGGSLVTHSPREAMNLVPSADYGIIGEGDVTDVELVETLQAGGDVSQVESLIYRQGGETLLTPERSTDVVLDQLPWPDYQGFGYFDMLKKKDPTAKLIAPLNTSRSCPFHCTFCSRTGKGSYRTRNLDLIFEEMHHLVNHYGVQEFRFNDELFADNSQRVQEFCQRIAPMNLSWGVYMRLSKNIDLELLTMMKQAGCCSLFYGLESACDPILKSMQKGTSEGEMLRILSVTKEAGLSSHGSYIFGDTLETKATVEHTLNWVEKHFDLVPDVNFAAIMLLPGSHLYEKAVAEGKITDTTQFILDGLPLVNVSAMSQGEYDEMVFQTIPLFTSKLKQDYFTQEMKDVTIVPSSGGYSLGYPCGSCGEKVTTAIVSRDVYYYRGKCAHCHSAQHFSLATLYMNQFQEAITQTISAPHTALWGVGNVFYQLYQSNPFLKNNPIKVLDKNPKKQGLRLSQLQVESPEILAQGDITQVVVTTANELFPKIRDHIQATYPAVKEIHWVFDLGIS